MTRLQRRLIADAREKEIRANLKARRPVVVLMPRRLARLGLTVAVGMVACFVLALAGCAHRRPVSPVLCQMPLAGAALGPASLGDE